MQIPTSIAYIDAQRQLFVLDPTGTRHPASGGDDLLWATWGQTPLVDVHSWPVWSPDGRLLAAFRIARAGDNNRVWVTDLASVHSVEVGAMDARVPIYLQWSIEGDRLAILSQDNNELVLQVADPRAEVRDVELLRGSPLFFSRVAGGRLAAFVGEGTPTTPQLAVIHPDGRRLDLSGTPGNFCAPVALPRGVAYVAHARNQVVVLASSLDGSQVQELEVVDGLVALLASPDGRFLARAISPDGSGSPYHDLSLLEISTAKLAPITDRPCLAFFWLPSGDGLVIASKEEDRTEVSWSRVDLDGTLHPLMDLVPSRDTRVYLRFFEQYGPSHPIVDPTGRVIVLCGALSGDDDGPSRVFLVPLDGSPPEEIGDGLFATFAPNVSVLEP